MNKLYYTLFYCLIFVSPMHTMELAVSEKEMPHDIGTHVFHSVLLYFHNLVNTPEQARDYLVSVSLVNKYCNEVANNPHVIKNIISNLSATLSHQKRYIFYEETIAEDLRTPATKKYIKVNNQIFSDQLTKSDAIKLLREGADPNYRRDLRNRPYPEEKDCPPYDKSRHYYTSLPLLFYASGTTDNDLEIAQCLLEHGADINRSIERDYPLSVAIRKKSLKMVKLFLAYYSTFSERVFPYFEGKDYLSQAMRQDDQDPEIIKLLMNAKNPDFIPALRIAINKKDSQQVQALFNCGAKPDELFKEVNAFTLRYPYMTSGDPATFLPTLTTTDMLQLFCDNITQDSPAIESALVYAYIAEQRVKEVIKILRKKQSGKSSDSYDDVPDLIPDIAPIIDNV